MAPIASNSTKEKKLWPPLLRGSSAEFSDLLLVPSFIVFFAFLFRQVAFHPLAPIPKMIPVGFMAISIFLKRNWISSCSPQVSLLSLIFLFHSFGDALLAREDSPQTMGFASSMFGLGWIFYSYLLWNRIPASQKTWASLSFTKKCVTVGLYIWGFTIVSVLLSTTDFSKSDAFWSLLLVPYVVCIISFLAVAFISNQQLVIVGTLFYVVSDSLIVIRRLLRIEFNVTIWLFYYIAQWLLMAGGLQWIQSRYNSRASSKSN
eukprot:TRINITY_DN1547_c0_g1_i1.p1 TRINITY_DN1547_c0_g1~~TRINITY_DN1547_c0_g1_i1.p1  ORF type:complete len:261 (+),score=81.10 TRINITY_DN1547_c0_g1_i1:125-907(+)